MCRILAHEPLRDAVRPGRTLSPGKHVSGHHHLIPPRHDLLLNAIPAHRPLRAVHSALCTRVVLNLRKAAAGSASGMSVTLGRYAEQTTLVFNTGGGAAGDPDSERSYAEVDSEVDSQRD